jgi:hypothetical protein
VGAVNTIVGADNELRLVNVDVPQATITLGRLANGSDTIFR